MASTTRWMAIACVALAACVVLGGCAGEPDASECTTGITCPEGTQCAAAQAVCITNDCGDAITQTSEACDDGNIVDGDGCSADCRSREVCGDGILNAAAGELCDDRNTTGGDGCAADCRSVEICGNGVRDVNEACDDNNTVPGDGCSGNCKSTEICGNNIVDINEKCDDGGAAGGCNDDCQGGTGCGDGAIDKDGLGNPLEECDDGNTDNQDDCTNTCQLNLCGDGIVQTSGVRVEQCDPAVNFGETPSCNLDCTNATCGDGKINKAAGEQCDNFAQNADDRDCTATCKVNVCGDAKPNLLGPVETEQCDDGNSVQTDGCSNECTTPTCGNGVREMTEACDDFNLANGDGCSSSCQFETCGDGVVNNGEDCDPGPMIETMNCNVDCTTRMCGDRKVNKTAGEQCDDMNSIETDACRNNCKLNVCGDGVKSTTELCDDGNANNADGCTTSCTTPNCGNGIKDMGEQCDDGNNSNTDGCLATCVYASCGDGFTEAGVEQCDNGAVNNGATRNCLANCKSNVCGDGFRDQEGSQTETCDDNNIMTETECPYGIQSCTMCKNDCSATLQLTGNICGDNNPASPEVCDDGNTTNETSCPYGTQSCTPCNSSCSAFLSMKTGPFCGDGTVQSEQGEACDDRSPTQSCGRCDNACNVFSSAALAATGIIIASPGLPLKDNDYFTLVDGFGQTRSFEFDTNNNGVTPGRVEVDATVTDSAETMRNRIRDLITASGIGITATDAGTTGIKLTNSVKSSRGNQLIVDQVDTSQFYIDGMKGGAAGDCDSGVPCTHNDDCVSGVCTPSLNTCF